MPAAKPPTRTPGQEDSPPERTDPGGPAADLMSPAQKVQAGPGDATLVYDKNKGRPRSAGSQAPRLAVMAGPRKGAEFLLTEDVTTIGRGESNTLVISDISVSRQHVRLERQGESWVLHDQRSGNGTRVNGKTVDRYPLKNGDEIEMGDTKVRFVEPGGVVVRAARRSSPEVAIAAAAPEIETPALRRRLPLYGATALALAIVFAAGLVRRAQRAHLEAEAARQGDESRQLAQQRFQEGVLLLKQGRWTEARDKLKIASELDGQDAEIARYLESAEAEAPRAQALATAKAALAGRDFAGTRGALAGIPEDSVLAESAHDIAQQLGAALTAAVREARSRAEAGDLAAAAALLEPVLAADPSRADALAVQESIAGQKRAAAPRRGKDMRAAVAEPPPPPAADVQSILEAYLAGDVGAAIERAQAARSPRGLRLLPELRQFDVSYKDGLAKEKAQRLPEAVRALETAAAADRSIAPGQEGRPGREVKKALAALHTQMAAGLSGDDSLPEQAAHLRAAVQNDPANETAKSQLRRVADRAKEIYLRGYVAKDEDVETARKAFKLVIETLPPADETAQKARRWIDKLDGKVAED